MANRKKRAPNHPPEDQLEGFKFFKQLVPLLERLKERAEEGNRVLEFHDYVVFLLFYYLNPLITSMRGLQQVSELPGIQKKLGVPKFSLGSFSESSSTKLFDAKILLDFIKELSSKMGAVTQKLDKRLLEMKQILTAVDGTLLPTLSRVAWALWMDDKHRAAKAHVHYEILKGVAVDAEITHGSGSETSALKSMLEAGRCYVLDRGYAAYDLLGDIIAVGSSFVVRVKSNAIYEVIEERELRKKDRDAGVLRDALVRLGSKRTSALWDTPVRLVTVMGDDGKEMILCTNILDIDADLVSLIYRHRWHVELFFRWFKQVLGVRHLISESQNGIAIQVYCAMIVSILIALWTGRKPTKRTFELVGLFLQGWATVEDVERHIDKLAKKEESKKINA
ncbi:MAG: IS4 family transposase [Planctomycetes bacterium]|nr:IS4 family transposase [Planctomycetota bacterium]